MTFSIGSRQITSLLSASGTLLRGARISEKVAQPGACLVIGHLDPDRDVAAMALAEPVARSAVAEQPYPAMTTCPWSFVDPDMWGRGLGGQLLQGYP